MYLKEGFDYFWQQFNACWDPIDTNWGGVIEIDEELPYENFKDLVKQPPSSKYITPFANIDNLTIEKINELVHYWYYRHIEQNPQHNIQAVYLEPTKQINLFLYLDKVFMNLLTQYTDEIGRVEYFELNGLLDSTFFELRALANFIFRTQLKWMYVEDNTYELNVVFVDKTSPLQEEVIKKAYYYRLGNRGLKMYYFKMNKFPVNIFIALYLVQMRRI